MKDNFSFNKMSELLSSYLNKHNKTPKQVSLQLPKLKKVGSTPSKIQLPKLNKIGDESKVNKIQLPKLKKINA